MRVSLILSIGPDNVIKLGASETITKAINDYGLCEPVIGSMEDKVYESK